MATYTLKLNNVPALQAFIKTERTNHGGMLVEFKTQTKLHVVCSVNAAAGKWHCSPKLISWSTNDLGFLLPHKVTSLSKSTLVFIVRITSQGDRASDISP